LEAGEAGDAVVLVHDSVAAAEAGEGGDRTRTRRSLAAPEQPVFRQNRELELWGEEALAQARGGKHHAGLVRRGAVKELGTDACEVVLRPLALPAPGPSHHRPVSRPDQLLKLRLGLPQRLRRRIRTLGAENVGLIAADARELELGARFELVLQRIGLDVKVVRIVVVEARGDVLPEIRQRGTDL